MPRPHKCPLRFLFHRQRNYPGETEGGDFSFSSARVSPSAMGKLPGEFLSPALRNPARRAMSVGRGGRDGLEASPPNCATVTQFSRSAETCATGNCTPGMQFPSWRRTLPMNPSEAVFDRHHGHRQRRYTWPHGFPGRHAATVAQWSGHCWRCAGRGAPPVGQGVVTGHCAPRALASSSPARGGWRGGA